MKQSIFATAMIAALFAACGQQQQVKAKVFERRQLQNNRLMIRYQYEVNNKPYTDSATVVNVVINTDSIFVITDPSNPARAIPDFTK